MTPRSLVPRTYPERIQIIRRRPGQRRGRPLIRTHLVTIVGLSLAIAAAASTPPQIRVETDVDERYYDVYGTNADEIFASIGRQKLGGEAGLSASGLTTSELEFALSTTTDSKSCRLAELTLRAKVLVTLPRHAQPHRLDGATRRHWEAYEALIEFHEYRHVEIEFQGVQELQARLEREAVESPGGAGACRAFVERAIREQAEVTRRRHDQFHTEESRAVRDAQQRLLDEVAALDARLALEKQEIDRLAREHADLEAVRARYVASLEALTHEYGRSLPPSLFAEADEMSRTIDALTEEITAVFEQRNGLVPAYNGGLEERAELATRLSWTR